MPFDKNLIWAGTDIGLFETTDGGANWSLLTDIPSVAIYDMKVVNDQVVIATYGRGIWSATISELNTYTLPSYLGFATASTQQKGIDQLNVTVSYKVPTDEVSKVKIFIDGTEVTEVIQDFNKTDTYTFDTANLVEGYHQLGIQVFEDVNSTQSVINNQEFLVIDFDNSDTSIVIDEFASSDVFTYKSDFNVDDISGSVSSLVLNNADHPYANGKTYATVLRKPLTITETNKIFSYEDLAIVEPYTDDLNDLTQFYDFVIIEASTDLNTWLTLDKYDARRFSEWLDEFNKGVTASASDGLFKKQTITLTDKGFSIGETLVIRFRLITDTGTTSFGWAIKSINVATASVNDVLNDIKAFTIYPTISNGNFTLFGKNDLGKAKMTVFNITGQQVYNKKVNFSSNEKQEVSVNLTAGVYIVNIVDGNNKKSSSKIVIE
jgi:hypothetical protein